MASPTPERTSELRYPVGPLPCGYARAVKASRVRVGSHGVKGVRGFGGRRLRNPHEPSGTRGKYLVCEHLQFIISQQAASNQQFTLSPHCVHHSLLAPGERSTRAPTRPHGTSAPQAE